MSTTWTLVFVGCIRSWEKRSVIHFVRMDQSRENDTLIVKRLDKEDLYKFQNRDLIQSVLIEGVGERRILQDDDWSKRNIVYCDRWQNIHQKDMQWGE